MKAPRAPHGSNSRYSRGCRCDPCRIAHRTYRRARTSGESRPERITHPPVPVAPLVDVCARLQGVPADQLDRRAAAAILGITPETLHRWIRQGHLPEPSADYVATRLGWHPATLWGLDWYMGLSA